MSRIASLPAVAGVATTAPDGRAAFAVAAPDILAPAPVAGVPAGVPQSQHPLPSIANLAPAQ